MRLRPLMFFVFYCFYFFCRLAYAEKFPFEEAVPLYSGARALAMGNAFVSVSDDGFGGFWNPAGLIQWQGVRIFGMTKLHDRQQYAFDPKGVGYSYRGYSLFWGNKIAIRTQTQSGVPDFNYYSIAKQLNSYISLGASLKFKRKHPYPKYQFFGFKSGYDLGALIKPSANWKFGVVGEDSDLNFKLDAVIVSFAYENRRFKFLTPIDLKVNSNQKNRHLSIYAGIERELRNLFIRSGFSAGYITGGVGIKLHNSLCVDYALIREKRRTSHFASAEIRL